MLTRRTIFAIVAWIFVGAVVVQVFLAGIGLFGAGSMSLHREFGYYVPMVALFVLIAAAVARSGSRLIGAAGVLLVISIIQTSLPYLKEDVPFVAALHPVNALAIAWLGLLIANRATALARAARLSDPTEATGATVPDPAPPSGGA